MRAGQKMFSFSLPFAQSHCYFQLSTFFVQLSCSGLLWPAVKPWAGRINIFGTENIQCQKQEISAKKCLFSRSLLLALDNECLVYPCTFFHPAYEVGGRSAKLTRVSDYSWKSETTQFCLIFAPSACSPVGFKKLLPIYYWYMKRAPRWNSKYYRKNTI